MGGIEKLCWLGATVLLIILIVMTLPCAWPKYYRNDPENPQKVVIWLHGHNMDAWRGPALLGYPDYVVIAPRFRKEADWQNYDLGPIIRLAEGYNLPLEIEGYSRGAYGAAYHAAKRPGVFQEVRCLAGYYPDFPQVVDPIIFYAGTLDYRWKHSTVQYAKNLGKRVRWVDSTHNPQEFYKSL